MEAVMNGGASAPAENVETPAVSPDGAAPEAVKPAAAEPPAAKTEGKSDDEPKGVAKRIKELTEARRAAEAREERLLRLLEQQRQTPTTQGTSDEEPEKTLEDFKYDTKAYLAYEKARMRASADKEAKEAAARYQAEQEAITRRAKFDERLAAFGKTAEDFDGVVDWLYSKAAPISDGMADFLMDSEESGLLALYLHNNEDEARKLFGLSAAKTGRELQKLEDRLVAERKKAAEKPVSQAPPPAPKIDAKDAALKVTSTSDPEADKLSDAEWFRLAEKERLKKRKGE